MRAWILGHEPTLKRPFDVHWPLIGSEPFKDLWDREAKAVVRAWADATIAIWTSREAVKLWDLWRRQLPPQLGCESWTRGGLVHWCIGAGTLSQVHQLGATNCRVARAATAEGLLHDLLQEPLEEARILWLHAAGARSVLREGLRQCVACWTDFAFYETRPRLDQIPPPYERPDRLVFTSPSCVQAWERLGWPWPPLSQIEAIGPITASALEAKLGARPKMRSSE